MEVKLKKIRLTNPLLSRFETDFESIPFDKIKPKDFIPAIKKGISSALDSIHAICNNANKPTFENTNLAIHLDSLTEKIVIFFTIIMAIIIGLLFYKLPRQKGYVSLLIGISLISSLIMLVVMFLDFSMLI